MGAARPITASEIALIEALAGFATVPVDLTGLAASLVTPMADGGMGSIAIGSGAARPLKDVATGEAGDLDGVLLSLCLFVDQAGRPRELDIWKVDFSPLLGLPNAVDLLQVEQLSTRR